MVIKKLELVFFRNYCSLISQFSPGINFIHGRNGQGKTNLIEALFVVTHLKSFRTTRINELETFTKNASSIRAVLTKQSISHEIVVDLYKNQKKVCLDQKKVNYTSEYIKNLFSILFSPDQLTFFKEYPLERRSFIDRILILVDQSYFQLLKDFNRVRKQKSVSLRQGNSKNISVWNQLFASLIPKITLSRRKLVETINEVLTDTFAQLTGRNECLKLHYLGDLDNKTSLDDASIFSFLQNKQNTEIGRGFLCYGPQKDLFWLTLDDRKDKQYFSQGEYRITFLALQFAINLIVKKKLGFNPIILLDDIFSELDQEVYDRTINYIYQRENQVFITSTAIPAHLLDRGDSYLIKNGILTANR
jgi:DNA replication and repair protein RecF